MISVTNTKETYVKFLALSPVTTEPKIGLLIISHNNKYKILNPYFEGGFCVVLFP